MPTYTVIGHKAYEGHEPGDTFTANLSPGQESLAIDAGLLRRADFKHEFPIRRLKGKDADYR